MGPIYPALNHLVRRVFVYLRLSVLEIIAKYRRWAPYTCPDGLSNTGLVKGSKFVRPDTRSGT